ncbi:unnamed protein product [Prunus brigantina]
MSCMIALMSSVIISIKLYQHVGQKLGTLGKTLASIELKPNVGNICFPNPNVHSHKQEQIVDMVSSHNKIIRSRTFPKAIRSDCQYKCGDLNAPVVDLEGFFMLDL